MNKIILQITIVTVIFFIEVITENRAQTTIFSLFQKEFRKGKIAC